MTELVLAVENVGGIERTKVTVEEGVTLIAGENASNKTSLLRALLFALSTDDVPLRTGADRAVVELTVNGQTTRRTATQDQHGVSVNGDPFIENNEDATLFTRFAGLLETNPLRTAVQTNMDFEELLKEPMNINSIEQERDEKVQRKRTLQTRLGDLDGAEEEIDTVKSDLGEQREEVEALSTKLDALYEELPEQDEDDHLEELRQRRSELVNRRENLVEQIDDLEAAVERLDADAEERAAKLNDAEAIIEKYDLQSLRHERAELRDELAEIDERIDTLQSVLTANREMIDADMRSMFAYEAGLDKDSIECWACGQQSQLSSFEKTIEQLTTLISQESSKRQEYEPEIREVEQRIEDAEDAKRRASRLEQRLQSAKEKRETRITSLKEKREQLSEIEGEMEDVDGKLKTAKDKLVDEHSKISKDIENTRAKLETKRREVTRLESTLSELQNQQEEYEAVNTELTDITTEIQELTTRIENLEADLQDAFNTAMDNLLDALNFEDIERMRLDGKFELVLARQIDGTVREDSVDHLAESERHVVGLVFGLAGYLAYDVETISPILVLDSLGAFDAERTQRLVEYFAEHTDYLITAVHPEQVDGDSTSSQLEIAPGQK